MKSFSIGDKRIGPGWEPFIIAEAGINHNGDLKRAKEMVLAAKAAKASAIKFQTFAAKDFIQDRNLMYTYTSQGKEITEPILDMFERCEFSPDEWRELKRFCDENELMFLSTPGNLSDLELLLSLGVKAIKVSSDDFVNIPLIRKYAAKGLPMILSCGMATEEEIDITLGTLEKINPECCLLLCTAEYPTPPADVNIRKLTALRNKYDGLAVGLSDHTQGSTAAIMAVALGASVFEKHFTLDHDLPGPDHWFSETPETLKAWVEGIREAYRMLGTGEIRPTDKEMEQRNEYHRSVTTARAIRAGEVLDEGNLCMRRPGGGILGVDWDKVEGKKAKRDLEANVQITWDDLER